MCGIAGAFGAVDQRIANAVIAADAAQRHRGPNDNGLWRDPRGGVILAHRRLSILDLSPLGHQPMIDESSGVVLVFNGEIYNFPELRAELIGAGHTFKSHSDTEVILRGFVQWGQSFIARLAGMYALAIWDPRDQSFFLARDPLGQKPLYYYIIDEGSERRTIVFASEVRAMLATGIIDRKLDSEGLSNYIWNGFIPGPGTIISGVQQLPPGTSMTFNRHTFETPSPVVHWKIPAAERSRITSAEVEQLMRKTVKEHLAADVPLGVFLSGGIDSSAVARMACDVSDRPVKTFTIGFKEAGFDESTAAANIAKALKTEHTNIPITGEQFCNWLPNSMQSLDQPTFDGLNSYLVSRAVREAGLTVALAGTGGDELFGGYRSFRDIPRALRWGRRLSGVPKSVRRIMTNLVLNPNEAVPRQTRWGKLSNVIDAGADPVSVYQLAYALFTPSFGQKLLDIDPPLQCRHGLPESRYEELREALQSEPTLPGISRMELSLFLGDRLLRDTDAASMAVSLEVRLPLIDQRIVEAVGKLPQEDRYFPLGRKSFLRENILGDLDPKLFDASKRGFVLPFDNWLRGSLKPVIDASLNDTAAIRAVGLNPKVVGNLWNAFLQNRPGLYWSRIWSIHTLIDWSRRHNVTI